MQKVLKVYTIAQLGQIDDSKKKTKPDNKPAESQLSTTTDGESDIDTESENSEGETDFDPEPVPSSKKKKTKIVPMRPCRPKTDQFTEEDVIDRALKWSVQYDGGKDIMEFLERLEELADTFHIPRDMLLNTLPELLKTKALEWQRNNKQRWTTWNEFRHHALTYFLPRNYKKSLTEEILR